MAIEDILQTLDAQAEADVRAVIDEARQHADHILDEAERDAQRVREGYVRQANRTAATEASKLVNAARLEAKMTISTARGGAVEKAFDLATAQLAHARESAEYDRLFAELAHEALAGLSGPVVMHVDPADESRARALNASGVDITVQADIESFGGVMVEADTGRIVRRNTFEDRAERVRQYVQADVAKALFA